MSRISIHAVVLAGAASLLAGPAIAQEASGPTVTVESGTLRGKTETGVDAFLGVPFAAPPEGDLRWRSPQPVTPWLGELDATQYGANCIQLLGQGEFGPWTHEYVVTEDFSEDCLYLNVWKPSSAAAGADLPVMVWIHGGGMTTGSGSVPIYEGRNLASKDMVVVTINYRVGALGFLTIPELTAEGGDGPISNFGFQDQIASLEWVRDNIRQFGGDPDKVTIAGQSAGSASVHAMVASPLAAGLFRAAIAQAGLPTVGRTPTLEAAEQLGLEYMGRLGVSSLAELRAMPADYFQTIPAGETPLRLGPAIDGVLLPDGAAEMELSGRASDVAMLVGQNGDEVLGGMPPSGETTVEEWREALVEAFGDHADAIGALYPSATPEERTASLSQMHRDRAYARIWQWGAARAEANDTPLYVYQFRHIEPGPDSATWRSFHSNEIPYIFGTLDAAPERDFTFKDWQVSLTTSDMWANFVKTGTPSAHGSPNWPAFSARNPQMMDIEEVGTVTPILSPAKREAFSAYMADAVSDAPF